VRLKPGLGISAASYNTTSQIASYAVVVDAKDDSTVAFYKKYDFKQFPDRPNRLFLPMNKIKTLFPLFILRLSFFCPLPDVPTFRTYHVQTPIWWFGDECSIWYVY